MKPLSLFDEPVSPTTEPRSRRVQGGCATTDVVMSAHVAGNAEVFAEIADLHVPPGSTIADVTYGKGVFWQKMPVGKYNLLFSDVDAKEQRVPVHNIEVQTGIDNRVLPFTNNSLDCLVFDPPYI